MAAPRLTDRGEHDTAVAGNWCAAGGPLVTLCDGRAHVLSDACYALCHARGQNVLPCLPCPGVSDDTSWARHRGIVFARRDLLLEHHDERLTDRRLDLAIGSSRGAQKTRGNYCTICCTIPDTGR